MLNRFKKSADMLFPLRFEFKFQLNFPVHVKNIISWFTNRYTQVFKLIANIWNNMLRHVQQWVGKGQENVPC